MSSFDIFYLAEKPECISACAAWAYGRWGVQRQNSSLDRALQKFSDGAQKEALPLTIISIDKKLGTPIGMGSLWENDGIHWPEVTPWIASVFTLYRYRNKGVAKAIIGRLEKEAKRLGFKEVYLQSGSAAMYNSKLGYRVLEIVETNETAAGTETLFKKALCG